MLKLLTKKTFSLCLALALLGLSVFSACSGKVPGGEPPLSDVPVTDYTLIRGDASGTSSLRQMLELRGAMQKKFGVTVASGTDWSALTGENTPEAEKHEILIGVTNRADSALANAELKGKHGYILRSSENNIVITATSDLLLGAAVNRFIRDYLEPSDGYLPASINVNYTEDAALFLLDEENASLCLALPEDASALLKAGAEQFAELLTARCGADVQILQTDLPARAIFIGPADLADDGNGSDTASGDDSRWEVRCDGQGVRVTAPNDAMLISALAGLYETLTEVREYTLNGNPVLKYNKQLVLREGWTQSVPRVIGATYLGEENIAIGSVRCFYENVPREAVVAYQKLLTGPLEYIPTFAEGLRSATYSSNSNDRTLTMRYDAQTEELEILEILTK